MDQEKIVLEETSKKNKKPKIVLIIVIVIGVLAFLALGYGIYYYLSDKTPTETPELPIGENSKTREEFYSTTNLISKGYVVDALITYDNQDEKNENYINGYGYCYFTLSEDKTIIGKHENGTTLVLDELAGKVKGFSYIYSQMGISNIIIITTDGELYRSEKVLDWALDNNVKISLTKIEFNEKIVGLYAEGKTLVGDYNYLGTAQYALTESNKLVVLNNSRDDFGKRFDEIESNIYVDYFETFNGAEVSNHNTLVFGWDDKVYYSKYNESDNVYTKVNDDNGNQLVAKYAFESVETMIYGELGLNLEKSGLKMYVITKDNLIYNIEQKDYETLQYKELGEVKLHSNKKVIDVVIPNDYERLGAAAFISDYNKELSVPTITVKYEDNTTEKFKVIDFIDFN